MPPARTESRPTLINMARQLSARLAVERPEILSRFAPILECLEPTRHSDDFRCVYWFGQGEKSYYIFTGKQASIVEKLWRAWERGVPEVRQNDLLRHAESDSDRVVDLFGNHESWGIMLKTSGAGFIYLAEPE